jgi:hypothetical protein
MDAHLGHRDRAGEIAFRAVGERDVNHGESRKFGAQKKRGQAALDLKWGSPTHEARG